MFQLFANRRILFIVLIFLVLTWVVYVTSHNRANEGNVEYFLNSAMVPLESIFNYFGRVTGDTWQTVIKLARLKKENELLQTENVYLKAHQLGLDVLKEENDRLRAALGFQKSQPHELVSAEVISVNPGNWNSTFIINKGKRHNLKRNMAVITPDGVVGRIGEVRTSTAEVILITDARQGNFIGGIISRTRDMVIVTGGGVRGRCTLQPAVDNYFTDLRINDLLITSETSEIFPKGIPIGRVVSFSKKLNRMVTRAVLKPVVNLNCLQMVYVIKTKNEYEPKPETFGGSTDADSNP